MSSRLPIPAWIIAGFTALWRRPADQLPGLDGLRAIAVLLVVCDHWVSHWVNEAGLPRYAFFKLPNFYWGWTGVDLFFILSGFLIGQQLWRELGRTGGVDFWRFFLRRGLRIWPLYYVWLLFLQVAHPGQRPAWPDWAMLSNYWETRYGRSWSLATEEQFYLLMPLLLPALAALVARTMVRPAVIAALVAAAEVGRALTRKKLVAAGLSGAALSDAMYAPFHLHGEALLIGLLAAWVAVERPAWLQPAAPGRFAGRIWAVALGLAALGAALRTFDREVFAYLALGLVYVGALLVALTDRSWLTAPLRHLAFYPIARLSFGMYLNHLKIPGDGELSTAFGAALFPAGSAAAFLAGLALVILISAAAAAVTFVFVEQPGLQVRDRLLGHGSGHSHPRQR